MKKIFFLFAFIVVFSCSGDDAASEPADFDTSITMNVNGQPETFYLSMTDIVGSGTGGYTLTMRIAQWDEANSSEDYMEFTMPFKKKGKDIISGFYYFQSSETGMTNAVEQTFTSRITLNTNKRFKATFSANFTQPNGDQVSISDASVNINYNEPIGD